LQSARRKRNSCRGPAGAQTLDRHVEENVIAKARKALFGEEFTPALRLAEKTGPDLSRRRKKTISYFLEHYILLGNYARDADRFDTMDALFQEFLNHAGIFVPQDPHFRKQTKPRGRHAGSAGDAR